jgi:glutamate racemase
LDSGIGGIPYCRHFLRRNSTEPICYLADRLNFPYGIREREELVLILSTLIKKLVTTINPKITVLACNTASVSALTELRQIFPGLPFVGTVPAVKPAMLSSKTGTVGVLGTTRTIEDPYIQGLAGNCKICGIAAPELVEFVEHRFLTADQQEKTSIARNYIDRFRAAGADTLVLGCTHFLFLLEEFRQEAIPNITVFDSLDGLTRRIESLLDNNNGVLRAEKNAAANRLILTGTKPAESSWQNWATQLGFEFSLLDDI